MKNFIFIIFLMALSNSANADFTDCKNLYVGSLTATESSFLVVLKESKTHSSGSYAVSFNGWGEREQAQAVSILLAAKMSGHRVNVATKGTNICNLLQGGKVFSYVRLANTP